MTPEEQEPKEPLRYPKGGGIPGVRRSAPTPHLDGSKGEFIDRRKKSSAVYEFAGQTVYKGWRAIGLALGVSPTTAKRYVDLYAMPVVRLIGKRPMTTRGAIDEWIARLAGAERPIIKEIREKAIGDPRKALSERWRQMEAERDGQAREDNEGEGAAGGSGGGVGPSEDPD